MTKFFYIEPDAAGDETLWRVKLIGDSAVVRMNQLPEDVQDIVRAQVGIEIADALDAIDADDPGAAHSRADELLLRHAGPNVADAYKRLTARAGWWATA